MMTPDEIVELAYGGNELERLVARGAAEICERLDSLLVEVEHLRKENRLNLEAIHREVVK